MKCPSCNSEDVRRSRRRGPQEGMALRLKKEAPFRCRDCGLRFVARNEVEEIGSSPGRRLSFADYLGLRGWPRRVFTDQLILGGLLVTAVLGITLFIFAFAFGWVDPLFLHPDVAWTTPNH